MLYLKNAYNIGDKGIFLKRASQGKQAGTGFHSRILRDVDSTLLISPFLHYNNISQYLSDPLLVIRLVSLSSQNLRKKQLHTSTQQLTIHAILVLHAIFVLYKCVFNKCLYVFLFLSRCLVFFVFVSRISSPQPQPRIPHTWLQKGRPYSCC